MAGSRSTAPLNRSKSVLMVARFLGSRSLAFEIHANVAPLREEEDGLNPGIPVYEEAKADR
jgi:hypothetical protein